MSAIAELQATHDPDVQVSDVVQWYDSIRGDCLEMGRLKSDFDIEQFTVGSVGPFPAHQYHFLMRQYSIALLELRRLLNDVRKCELRQRAIEHSETVDRWQDSFFVETALEECEIEMETLDLSIRNKRAMCERFEACRKALIQKHGGKRFMDAEYQAEEPAYWTWYLTTLATNYQRQAATGIPEGLFKNLQLASAPPLLNKNNKLLIDPSAILDQVDKRLGHISA
jgi:hypothetical protein